MNKTIDRRERAILSRLYYERNAIERIDLAMQLLQIELLRGGLKIDEIEIGINMEVNDGKEFVENRSYC